MTWQGQGGAGGDAGPEEPDDATRTDWPVSSPPATSSQPGPVVPPAPMPTAAPPPPAGGPPVVAGASPWAPPDQSAGSWGTPPPATGGRYAVPGAPGLVYAGAIPRAAAYVVDSFLLGILVSIVTVPFAASSFATLQNATGGTAIPDFSQLTVRTGIGAVIGTVIEGLYFVFLWASSGRATLGMRLFGLQVGNAGDGARLRLDQAVRRWLAYGSWLTLVGLVPVVAAFIGLVQLAWTLVLLVTTASSPTKQGLHDRIAGSAVVRPATAGNGLAMACLLVAIVLPLIAVAFLLALVLVGGQLSSILSAVGESV